MPHTIPQSKRQTKLTAETAPSWLEEGLDHIWLPYTQMKTMDLPAAAVSTNGSRIKLADGRELIDGIASWWTSVHGYNHPHIIDAMKAQLDTMPHVMLGGLIHEPALKLCNRLAAMLPGGLNRSFIAESGSVCVEVAMKMCSQFYLNQGQQRTQFVHFRDGYHGDTLGTMGICDPEGGMHHVFGGLLADNILADLPRTELEAEKFSDLLMTHKDQIAAVITEPLVQGAGGMVMHEPQTLKWIDKACKAAGVKLIIDEIFTGFGRTGTMFAIEQAGIVPDVVTLSKALTGGVTPLSVAVASDALFAGFYSDDPNHALMHGPTYMGHALGCAAANASLDLFESEDRLAQVRAINAQLSHELKACYQSKYVKDVRTLGAIGVVQLNDPTIIPALKRSFTERGIWVKPFKDIVYLTPAYTITSEELSSLTSVIADTLCSG